MSYDYLKDIHGIFEAARQDIRATLPPTEEDMEEMAREDERQRTGERGIYAQMRVVWVCRGCGRRHFDRDIALLCWESH